MLNQSHKVSTNWSRVIATINVCVITTHLPRLNKTSFDLFSPLQIIWHDGDITQPREWGHMYKAAFDKDLIRASCQHVSRWPKNGGRQKILEKMVCCPDLGFPYTYIYIEFVLFDQPSPRQLCEEFVRWEEDLLRWTPARMHLMLLLYYQSLMPPLPTSCLVSSSLCNEYSPQNPAYLDLFLQQVANFCLPSMLRDRPTGQRQPFPKQRSEVASKSQRYLRLRPGFGGHPITQLPIFNLSPLRSLFTVSLRWWTPPPTPTPVWPFLLLCDWLEWTEDEAEKVPTKIPAPRSHLLRWSTSHGQSSSKVPILILSQSINRAGGAFPNISGPAQNCLPSQIHHSFQNILENYFLFLEMSLQGYLVVFRRNLFSAVNRTLTTCVCQPADLDLARVSLMVQGHIKNEIDKAQENCTSLNWSHILFKP